MSLVSKGGYFHFHDSWKKRIGLVYSEYSPFVYFTNEAKDPCQTFAAGKMYFCSLQILILGYLTFSSLLKVGKELYRVDLIWYINHRVDKILQNKLFAQTKKIWPSQPSNTTSPQKNTSHTHTHKHSTFIPLPTFSPCFFRLFFGGEGSSPCFNPGGTTVPLPLPSWPPRRCPLAA